jgi:Transposase DDE domain
MHQRNAIEGTISELSRAHGLRCSCYRGFAKVQLQNLFIASACNIKRWFADRCRSSYRHEVHTLDRSCLLL